MSEFDTAIWPGLDPEAYPPVLAMAVSGRPATPLALDVKVGQYAWKTLPS